MIVVFRLEDGSTLCAIKADVLPPPSFLMQDRFAIHDGRFFQCQDINGGYSWEDVTGNIRIDARQAAMTGLDCQYRTKVRRCMIRGAPSWDGEFLRYITGIGTLVDVIEVQGRWIRVYHDGANGWALASELEAVTE